MQRRLSVKIVGLAAALLAGTALSPRPAAASCESLQSTSFPGFTVTSATSEAAGAFTPPGGTAAIAAPFCRVVAVATPVAGSNINFEVWLPPAGTWNQKFRGEGSGGSAGAIGYSAMVDGLTRGYATMANDNGHTGSSWTFSQNPEAVVDFGYRAQHVTTIAGKQIVQAFYGVAPRHSYFVGCSQGGHHAQMEAQRYPTDYDGIIGGDPASDWIGQMTAEVWIGLASTVGGTDLSQAKLNLVTQAVLAQCAGRDGGLATDQFLTDPRVCHFNPAVLECPSGQDPSTCLTAAEVQAVQKIYRGPYFTLTGQKIAPGLAVGSEAYWRQVLVGTLLPGGSSTSFFRDGVFDDPNFDFLTFNFGSDVALAYGKVFAGQTLAQILNANDTDLEPFRRAGGKIIMYHGWADPALTPYMSVDYYESALKANGPQTKDFFRLFMVPGMFHCRGGIGVDHLDALTALINWVEAGKAPDAITATRAEADKVTRSRPLCPYPQVAHFSGNGNSDDAANFACQAPE